MKGDRKVAVIIPALNEEESIGRVLSAVPCWVDDVVVVDNGSTDRTADVAQSNRARVVSEPRRGYGYACLAGLASLGKTDIVVFIDGDFSDYPDEMDRLVDPLVKEEAEMVIGSRVLGTQEKGSFPLQARLGNRLSCLLMRLIWGVKYTDLGPFRAILQPTLKRLDMQDRNYGWTVEMQIKAAICGLRSMEVPVSYRKRIGSSKISGTLGGAVLAGIKIIYTIVRLALEERGWG